MNKQSNTYTIIYIIVLVVVVGAALAFTSLALRDKQQANADADKMKQILASANIIPDQDVVATFDKYIVDQYAVNEKGEKVDGDAFTIDMAKAVKEPAATRKLPVFVCRHDDGNLKYIIPVYGAGLWGPIWGYLAFDDNGTTIYGAYFAHQGETPGLGAEIEKPFFSDEFKGKKVFVDGKFLPIEVVKAGQKPVNPESDYVDGITGGTITSKGVGSMIDNCLTPYSEYLMSLNKK